MHGSSQGTPFPVSGLGGLVTLANPNALPEGASPRCHDNDFLVGSIRPRPGLRNKYTNVSAQIGPNFPGAASSSTWNSPDNILANDGSFTSTTPLNVGNSINVQEFAFSVPMSSSLLDLLLTLKGFSNVADTIITAQLLINGILSGTPQTVTLPQGTSGTVTLGSTLWGTFLTAAQANAVNFGVQLSASNASFTGGTAFLDSASITLSLNTGTANFNFITTFVAQNGIVRNLLEDANGNLYVENVSSSPGTYSLVIEDITPGSSLTSINGPDVEYLTFFQNNLGSDQPLQYTPNWTDRITQVGPGAAPSFTPGQASTDTFNITSITQPPSNSDPTDPGHLSVLLQSAGPGSTSPGTTITVYYAPSFVGGSPAPGNQDTRLVNEFNSGNATYVYISGTGIVDGTYLVTSVGNALPPGVDHFRYYFTVQATTSAYENIVEAAGQYQQTLATLTTAAPVPGLAVGNDVTIAGASIAGWDNTWQITQALNSASMVITQTSVTASVATYSYSVSEGTPPVAGQLVTVTGTTNADGALNVANATIVSSTGGTSGTFTVSVPVVTAASAPEDGLATTAGTIFTIDPGPGDVGTSNNPILGNSTGGTLTYVAASAQLIGPGTRQGSVGFITRNGYYTAPAFPVTFTCPENTLSINAANIPIGPPNVIARYIIFTEAGQNGVPGANFFNIPTPVTYIVDDVSYTATSLIINDNVTTSASFQFTDSVLLNSRAMDVYGFNLFNNIEIGNPTYVDAYVSRNCYGKCLNKIQNFNNLSFDGGFLPAGQTQGQLLPLGWTSPDIYGQLTVSPKFGNAYYIQNTSSGTLSVAGLISQTAFQDGYLQPILNANTLYSLQVTARCPSGLTTGNLVITLTSGGVTYGSFTLPFASMTTSDAIYTGTLMITAVPTVPTGLTLNVSATEIGAGADVEIDRIDIYPTAIPYLTTTEFWSYAGLPEQVDAVTGVVVYSSENQQPINGSMTLYDTHYVLKAWDGGSSLYSLQASDNLEPAQWRVPEVAQRSGGAIGPLAFDLGEQWFVGASRQGVYLFSGGQPGKIMQEIYQIWQAINWAAGNTIWLKVDIEKRRMMIGVPLPTPNPWLPFAPLNNAPTSPNVILMCNFQGLDSGEAIKSEPQMHTTMFGALNAIDMRRKWTIWQIASPYGNFIEGADGQEFAICNGLGNSKVYTLDETSPTDDGSFIDQLYTTAGLPGLSKIVQMQQQLGRSRVRWGYLIAPLETEGNTALTLYANRLTGMPNASSIIANKGIYPTGQNYLNTVATLPAANSWTLPGGFAPGAPADDDVETPLNFAARRAYFEWRENDGWGFSLSGMTPIGGADVWNQLTGQK